MQYSTSSRYEVKGKVTFTLGFSADFESIDVWALTRSYWCSHCVSIVKSFLYGYRKLVSLCQTVPTKECHIFETWVYEQTALTTVGGYSTGQCNGVLAWDNVANWMKRRMMDTNDYWHLTQKWFKCPFIGNRQVICISVFFPSVGIWARAGFGSKVAERP